MQFLSVSVRRLDRFADAEFEVLVEAEARRARELYAEGFIRQIWRRSDQPGACILWEADSAEQVGDQLQTLPFIRAGMLDVSIFPLLPYAGFGTEGRLSTFETETEVKSA
jgi:muconolactone delta-isomerase